MRVTSIAAVICAFVGGTADASSDPDASAVPALYDYYLKKATLSPDAPKVISVLGEVPHPHTIQPAEGLTVSKAIEMAGGFTDLSHRRRVGIWRPKEPRFLTVDVKAALQKERGATDPVLGPGDVVIVIVRLVD